MNKVPRTFTNSLRRFASFSLASVLLVALAACSGGGANPDPDTAPGDDAPAGSEVVTWRVTGTIDGMDNGNRFTVGWSIEYPNGGETSVSQVYDPDTTPLFSKEETLDQGTIVTLTVNSIPDAIDPKETFTLDLEATLLSGGEVVATEAFRETIQPSDAPTSFPDPPLTYTVGE